MSSNCASSLQKHPAGNLKQTQHTQPTTSRFIMFLTFFPITVYKCTSLVYTHCINGKADRTLPITAHKYIYDYGTVFILLYLTTT